MKKIGREAAKKKKKKKKNGPKHHKKRIPAFCIAHFLNNKAQHLAFLAKVCETNLFFFFFFFFCLSIISMHSRV